MKNSVLKGIKKSSLFITPNLPDGETKRYKVGFFRLAAYLSIYTLLVVFATVLVIIFTPVRSYVFVYENDELRQQTEQIKNLETKIIFLTKELETFASINRKLSYARMLASDSVDDKSGIYDSLKKDNKVKIPLDGNVLSVFRKFINGFFYQEDTNKNQLFFIKPANGDVVQSFNPKAGHMGIDVGLKTGSSVYAAAGGLVIFSDYTADYGHQLIIQHDNGYITFYLHCQILFKKAREIVMQGELIALSGNSGSKTTGPHLHFEIWHNGNVVDPEEIIINYKRR